MRFLVPQFIEVEDKIFGPLSFRQFIYVAGAVGFCVILYSYIGWVLALLFGAPVLALGFSLAFYKFNNRSFVHFLQAIVQYFAKSKLYLWKQAPKKKKVEVKKPGENLNKTFVPKVSENKLKDLAWSLDIKESMFSNENQAKETKQ